MSNSINNAIHSGKYMDRVQRYDHQQYESTANHISEAVTRNFGWKADMAQDSIDSARRGIEELGDRDPAYTAALEARIEREQKAIDDAAWEAQRQAESAARDVYDDNVKRYENEGYSRSEAESKAGKKDDCTIM